jgi:hypothetical protein
MFNARVETIDTTPAFRDAFTTHRCLIPADGYFEWTTSLVDGKKDSGCCNYRPRAILLCRPLAAQPLAEALLEGSGEEAANTVRLPVGDVDDLGDGGAVLPAQQPEDDGLLGLGLRRRCGFAVGTSITSLDRPLGHDGSPCR